jgi:hypothetical protein
MQEDIKVEDLLVAADQIFQVTDILDDVGTRVYTCHTWEPTIGFVYNSDYDMFTDSDIEDCGLEVYRLK